ncbi:MAG: hypothetical protein JKY37_22175 [Nannocystaceae bacterium]|nr:hypothetical protein [Nannocystaceae bacterium]
MATAKPMGGFWATMSPRERNLVLVLILVFFGMGTLLLFYMRGSSLAQTEQQILDLRKALDSVNTGGTIYKERLAAKREREKSISTDELAWASLVEEAARVSEGIEVTSEDRVDRQELDGGLIKHGYKFKLNSISLDALTKFLIRVETEAGKVIVTEKLTIRSHNEKEDRLQVDVTLATWQRQASESDAGPDDGDGDGRKKSDSKSATKSDDKEGGR